MKNLLLRPDVRLVNLLGSAGTGKTRLGLQVAAEVVDAGEDEDIDVEEAIISLVEHLGVPETTVRIEREYENMRAALGGIRGATGHRLDLVLPGDGGPRSGQPG